MEKRQKDMKLRIQETALKLFTRQGYDKTSLREIAEELNITKAALYYHFQSKEDILKSITAEISIAVEELMEWAGSEAASEPRREEFLTRFADLAFDRLKPFIPFAISNISSLQTLARSMAQDRKKAKTPGMLEKLKSIINLPGDDTEAQIRSILAIGLLLVGASPIGGLNKLETEANQIKRIALDAALKMLGETRTEKH